MLRHRIRAALRKKGIHLFSENSLPLGLDLAVDLRRLLPKPRTNLVLDVGANIGQTTRALLNALPDANVIAFEPVTATFQKLLHNLGNNSRVRCFHAAVGGLDGTVTMDVAENSLYSRISDSPGSSSSHEVVTCVSLDRFLSEHSISSVDLLKTDTEGRDLEVLKGCERYLSKGAVAAVLTEFGFSASGRANTPLGQIFDFLAERGFILAVIYDPREWTRQPDLIWADALFLRR